MTRYEFKTLQLGIGFGYSSSVEELGPLLQEARTETLALLNALGADGWAVVGTIERGGDTKELLLQRPIKDEAQ